MPLNLAITPVAAPTIAGLAATATLKGILLTWTALQGSKLFAVEVWSSATNDRTAATLLWTVTSNYYLHAGLTSNTARYYWVRAKNIYGRTDGVWTPVSATAGVTATTLLAQTADLNVNAATTVVMAQSNSALIQTMYDTYESVLRYTFSGTGNTFVIDAQHLSNLVVSTIGTAGKLASTQLVEMIEHTIYSVGTISVTNGSAIVTGAGTTWVGNVVAGNLVTMPNGGRYVVQTVDTNGQITLTIAYAGATASAQIYYIITASVQQSVVSMETDRFEINGTYCLTHRFPFGYRFPHQTTLGKIYDCNIFWKMTKTDASWAATQSSVLKTVISEEIKR